MKKLFWLLIFLVFLSGCLKQELYIKLNSDGSGEYRVTTTSNSDIDSLFISALDKNHLKNPLEGSKNLPGGIIKTTKKIEQNSDKSSQYTVSEVYQFESLGRALPELEKHVRLGPRFAYRGDKFVVFRNREKNEFDGLNLVELEKGDYYHLSIELPAKPESKKAKIMNNVVSWFFDKVALEANQNKQIGESIYLASIPADAIKADIRPRLFQNELGAGKNTVTRSTTILDSFNARFPIYSAQDSVYPQRNADLTFNVPLENIHFPVRYEALKIETLIIEGKKIDVELESNSSGVFSGKNVWREPTNGLPVKIKFSAQNPWMNIIDRLELSVRLDTIEKTKTVTLNVHDANFPYSQIATPLNTPIVFTGIDFGSRALYLPHIVFLSSLSPDEINLVHLDSEYGLRYQAQQIDHKDDQWHRFLNDKIRDMKKAQFGDQRVYEYSVSFENIPNPPFSLDIEIINESTFKSRTITLENIDVSL